MSGKGRSTINANSDAVRCDKESTDVQCFCCGVSFVVGLAEESLELVKACSNVKFVCDGCLKSPSLEDQVIKSDKIGNAEICDKIDSLSKEIRLKIDAIKKKFEENESKMTTLDIPESKLCNKILRLKNEMSRSFASVVKELIFKNIVKMRSVGDGLTRVGLSHDLTVEQRTELKKFLDDARRMEKIQRRNFNLGLLNIRSIAPNVDGVYGLISDGLDVLVLTETWHGLAGNNSVNIAKPPGYSYVDFVTQHDPAHGGGTLDLVVSSADFPIISTTVFFHGVFSDHSLILIKAAIAKPRRITAKRFVRSWKKVDEDRFVEAVLNSPLSGSCRSNDVDGEIKIFNDELKSIIDRLVPKRVILDREDELKSVIFSSPTKTSSLDFMPTHFFKKYLDLFICFLTSFTNLCLKCPVCFNHYGSTLGGKLCRHRGKVKGQECSGFRKKVGPPGAGPVLPLAAAPDSSLSCPHSCYCALIVSIILNHISTIPIGGSTPYHFEVNRRTCPQLRVFPALGLTSGCVSPSEVLKAVKLFKNGFSGGLDDQRSQHLKDLFFGPLPIDYTMNFLTQFINLILSRACPFSAKRHLQNVTIILYFK
ncbi:hypothetical protein HELRODRAFT_177085 [Helobdella robusta]|uniref:Endonuclease/exonuclease/phosphatase domain-containing protein n=1 Tax=Helobdella robusta TaxID=6412 RepID=T1FB80_HELRO|nr:hypothetical protein HELRODRAFT_177085 [Helobdella robusta]ESN98218.1 hypothetical protein HELRODRAFT_177085 [Helobdella robusta]